MDFFAKLAARVAQANTLLCIGLDPHDAIDAAETRQLCVDLIHATEGFAAAYKPNSAFFERFGADGYAALKDVIAAVPESIPVILDAKRGDIGSTSYAYAVGTFDALKADAITVSPYLGVEAIRPYLSWENAGVFILCRTSNDKADEIQGLVLQSGNPLYAQIAQLTTSWADYWAPKQIGLVAGATDVVAINTIRAVVPDTWLLIPGVGAQGGDLEAAVQSGLRADRSGVLIAVSRQISDSDDPAQAAMQFRDRINAIRESCTPPSKQFSPDLLSVAKALAEAECVRFGSFTLKSGGISPIYLDLRRLVGYPAQMKAIASALNEKAAKLEFDHYAAIPYAALPITTAAALQKNVSMVYPRREAKDYGTKAQVEGVFSPGQTVLLIDDLATTGESKFTAIERLDSVGLKVRDVLVVIDRQGGAREAIEGRGYRFHSVATLSQLMDVWEAQGTLPESQRKAVEDYLAMNRPT